MAALRQRSVVYGELRGRDIEVKASRGGIRQGSVGYVESKGRDIEVKVSTGGIRDGEIGIRDCNKGQDIELKASRGGFRRGMGNGEIEIRECEDRGFLSSRSGGVVGLSRCRSGGDKEPGELSSDTASDGGIDEEDEIERRVSGNKRKFSPIVRDGDGVSRGVSIRSPSSKTGLDDGDSVTSRPSKIAKITKSSVELGSYISSCSSSLIDQTCSGEEEHRVRKDKEASIVENDDLVSLRNVRSSRWANRFDSPSGEGRVLEEEMPKPKKNKWDESLGVRSISYEIDERVWSSSRDSCSGHGSDNNDVEEDEDHHYDGGSASQSDTELEDALDIAKIDSPPRRNVNMLHGCRSVDEFERLNKINEGTYGVVYRARDKKTGEIVALKKVKMEKEREGFPLTALREINILLSFDHPSIVDVKEIVVGSSLDDIFLVMEYMEHDLKAFLKVRKQPFSESEVKCLMLQLLKGTQYLHDNWVLHRDLKTSNILLNNSFELKICDFGLARQYGSPLKPYTQLVVTLSYRAPELLLGAKQYSTAIDMWSLGCIMAELLSKETLFNGKSEIDQIDKIFRTLGTPNDTIWPEYFKLPGAKGTFVKNKPNILRKKFPPSSFTGAPVLSDAGFDLLSKLLTYDPKTRISAEDALEHKWFQEVPPSKDKETFLFWHGQDRHMQSKPKGKDLEQWGSRTGGVFG